MANEKRLIDANAEIETIEENFCKNCNSYGGVRCRSCWVDDVIGVLKDASTVDTVEVVRCKDCKHREDGVCNLESVYDYPWYYTNDEDFCSHGERRDKND